MMDERIEVGRDGEDLAVRFLQQKGYQIVERNFRFGRGEIDIIARDDKTLVFVEVKSRRSSCFGPPEQAVGRRKQRQLCRLALAYIQKERLYLRVDCRFDVVAISFEDRTIRLIRNAFQFPC